MILVQRPHMLINRLRFVKLPLSFKVQREIAQIVQECTRSRNPAIAVEGFIQATLPSKGKTHHPVGLRGFLI